MSVRSERFNGRMVSLDTLDAALLAKARALSDGGAAVRRLVDDMDRSSERSAAVPDEQETVREALAILWAIVLTAGGCAHLAQTLLLICRNGSDAKASVETIRRRNRCSRSAARRLYQMHRRLLLEMFVSGNGDGPFLDLTHPAFRFRVTKT